MCAALAECSYKPVDHSPAEALSLTQEVLAVSVHLAQNGKLHTMLGPGQHACSGTVTYQLLLPSVMQDLVPPQLISLHSVQFCKPHVRHRYMLAESDETLYVGIIGTKLRCKGGKCTLLQLQWSCAVSPSCRGSPWHLPFGEFLQHVHRRDLVTNANALQIRVWDDDDNSDGLSQEVCADLLTGTPSLFSLPRVLCRDAVC